MTYLVSLHALNREKKLFDYYYKLYCNILCDNIIIWVSGLPQHTKNRDDGEISGSNGHRLIGLLVGALSAATVLAGASLAFVMVRRRRMIRQVSRQSQSASFQECIADKPHLPPAIHLTVSPYTQIIELLHMTLKKTITPYL